MNAWVYIVIIAIILGAGCGAGWWALAAGWSIWEALLAGVAASLVVTALLIAALVWFIGQAFD